MHIEGDLSARPIKTARSILSASAGKPIKALLEYHEFIHLFRRRYPFKITRRALQLYSSPGYRLLPPPVHKGGHKSYYLHPEHTERLAVVLTLHEKNRVPFRNIATILQNFPPEYYRLILNGTFEAKDVWEFPVFFNDGHTLKDYLFKKIIDYLLRLEGDVLWQAEKRLDKKGSKAAEKLLRRHLSSKVKELAQWVASAGLDKIAQKPPRTKSQDIIDETGDPADSPLILNIAQEGMGDKIAKNKGAG
ncbi:MAG: hypothetical protein HYT79_08280 [Elusimicrobia bacterium]|nr:hypothetical protein [Elusimicrobiota bacterium]